MTKIINNFKFKLGFNIKTIVLITFLVSLIFAILSIPDYIGNGLWGWERTLYFRIYDYISHGQIPYKDFFIEYPPLAPYFITFPLSFTNGFSNPIFASLYCLLVGLWIIIYFLISNSLLLKLAIDKKTIAKYSLISLLCLILTGTLVFTRYDIFPAILTAIGVGLYILYLNKNKRIIFIIAILLIVLAGFLKLYPFLIIPLLIMTEIFRAKWTNIIISILIFLIILFINIPFILSGSGRFQDFLKYQTERDIQIESTYASGLFLLEKAGFIKTNVTIQYGALEINNDYTETIGKTSLPLIGLGCAAIYALFGYFLTRFKKHILSYEKITHIIVLFSITLISIFLFFNKVFSPQYIIWIITFIPLLALLSKDEHKKDRKKILIILISITSLTLLVYPLLYNLIQKKELIGQLLLFSRNIAVGVLIFFLVRFAVKIFKDKK
ncbi:MAG: glycosyltransferase 87 family protein [bacterium]